MCMAWFRCVLAPIALPSQASVRPSVSSFRSPVRPEIPSARQSEPSVRLSVLALTAPVSPDLPSVRLNHWFVGKAFVKMPAIASRSHYSPRRARSLGELAEEAEALGVPWIMLGEPWSQLGGPQSQLGAPWSQLGGPWSLLGGPWSLPGGPCS